jgi:hypothetical protein
MAIAGHVSRDMLEHYSHVRLEAKRAAVEALSRRRPEKLGYVTDGQEQGGTDIASSRKVWSGREELTLRPMVPKKGLD